MAEIRVPTLGESVTEATIGKWFKKAGDPVAVDEPLVELETDKVTIEVPAPAAGTLAAIAAKDGDTVAVGALLGEIKEGAGAAPSRPSRRRPAGRSEDRRRRADKPAAQAPKPEAEPKPDMPVRALGAQDGGRERHGSRDRAGLRQGRPRHQGRHDGGDRARRRAADACCRNRRPPCRCARRCRRTTPRAKSA